MFVSIKQTLRAFHGNVKPSSSPTSSQARRHEGAREINTRKWRINV